MATEGVSFAVPLYNKAPFVAATLDSIACQSGDFAREIIVVDDGSTDGGGEIVAAWARGRNDVTLMRQENAGSARATNRCLALARHPYVKFVDADDLLHPEATERLLRALRDHPRAGLAYCDRATFDGQPPRYAPLGAVPPRLVASPLPLVIRNALFNPTQILVRAELARAVGGCDTRVVHSQEYGLALRLAACAPFVHVASVLAFQRVGLTGNLSADQGRQLARVTRALGLFLADRSDLPMGVRRLAARRAAGRAWLYRHRHAGAGVLSRWSLRRLLALLPPPDAAAFVLASAEAFERPR
jgi:glycosyltransferase involved in cell wall biosynthesis